MRNYLSFIYKVIRVEILSFVYEVIRNAIEKNNNLIDGWNLNKWTKYIENTISEKTLYRVWYNTDPKIKTEVKENIELSLRGIEYEDDPEYYHYNYKIKKYYAYREEADNYRFMSKQELKTRIKKNSNS